jgi:hypothetical protein
VRARFRAQPGLSFDYQPHLMLLESMVLLLGSLLLYGGRDTESLGGILAVIVIVLLLALVGLVSLIKMGFGAAVPTAAPKQKEGSNAMPLLLAAVGITLLLCYLLVSFAKSSNQ